MWCVWSAGSVVYVLGLPGIQAVPEDEISSPCLCIQCYKWHDSRRRSCGAILQTKRRFMLVSTEALVWVVGLLFEFISEEEVVHGTRQPSNLPLLEKMTYGYVFLPDKRRGAFLSAFPGCSAEEKQGCQIHVDNTYIALQQQTWCCAPSQPCQSRARAAGGARFFRWGFSDCGFLLINTCLCSFVDLNIFVNINVSSCASTHR